MANRREFLQTAAVMSAAPLASGAFAGGRRRVAVPDAVIFDSRYREAGDFGAFAAELGAPLRAIEGDVTELWKGELLDHWRAAPGPLAGLTERPALFLLERLAWDHGLRVVFEAEHELDENGRARHRVLRSADPRLESHLNAAGESWTGVLADALVAGGETPARDFRPSGAAMAAHRREGDKLHSWIIAPRGAHQA